MCSKDTFRAACRGVQYEFKVGSKKDNDEWVGALLGAIKSVVTTEASNFSARESMLAGQPSPPYYQQDARGSQNESERARMSQSESE